jgi:hypothetical protein
MQEAMLNVFTLSEGAVQLHMPAVMSLESYHFFAEWIEIIKRGAERRAVASSARKMAAEDLGLVTYPSTNHQEYGQ